MKLRMTASHIFYAKSLCLPSPAKLPLPPIAREHPRSFSSWKTAANALQQLIRQVGSQTSWQVHSRRQTGEPIILQLQNHQNPKEVMQIHFAGKPSKDAIAIDDLLVAASTKEINALLKSAAPDQSAINMTRFLLQCTAGNLQNKVLDILTNQRLQDLELSTRIELIQAIKQCMVASLRQKQRLQSAVAAILINTYGHDLTKLKESVGLRSAPNVPATPSFKIRPDHALDLHQMVYQNSNVVEKVELLQHFAVQAAAIPPDDRKLKIISDIDDTLYAGWMDRRYPSKKVYPGVLFFYQLLASTEDVEPAVTFLTARPRGWFSMGKALTLRHLRQLGVRNPTVIPGSLTGLTSNRRIAESKFANFRLYLTLFPEYKFIFTGDSGQGDSLVGSWLLQRYPSKVLAVFIHDINPHESTTGDGGNKDAYKEQGVHFFQNYVEAGIYAHEAGLIATEGLSELCEYSQVELQDLEFTGKAADHLRALRLSELETSIEDAGARIATDSRP